MKRSLAIVSFLVAAWQPALLLAQASGDEQKPQRQISVDEIGTSVVLVGRLGVPLGKKMEVSGYWHFPVPDAKDASIRFTVTTVNGKKLAKPIEFNHEQLDFSNREHRNVIPAFKGRRELDGQTWTLSAYETGSIQIIPDEDGVESPVQVPYYTRPFTSQLVGIVQRKEGRTRR